MFKRMLADPTVLVLATGFMFGGSYVIVRAVMVSGVHPVWLLAVQGLVAGVGLGAVAAARQGIPFGRHHLLFYLLAGTTGMTLPRLMGTYALQELSAGLYSMLVALAPMLTWLVASVVARRLESVVKLGGVLIGLTGTVAILLPLAPTSGAGSISMAGLVLGVATPLLLAAGNVYRSRAVPRDLPVLGIAAGTALAQLPFLGVLLLTVDAPAPTGEQWPGLLLIGVWSLVAYLPYFRLQTVTDAVRFSQIGYVIPLTGIFGGVVLLDEALPASLLLGAPLVFLGLAVTNGHVPLPSLSIQAIRRAFS